MDSFEWNKIAGGVLFACLVAFGLGIFSDILFETETPEHPGYVIAIADPGEGGGGEAPASQPIGVLLASADPEAGANSSRKCAACHTFEKDGPNRVGPNLWDVVERPIAGHEGYDYDEAMETYAAEAGTWTYEHLNDFLLSPSGTVPGTKMAFAGLRDDSERANVIAYLRSLSDTPKPLPEVEPVAADTDAAAAEGEAPAEGDTASAESEAPAEAAPAASDVAASEPEASAASEAPAASAEAPSGPVAAPAEDQEAAEATPDSGSTAPAVPATEGQDATAQAAPTAPAEPAPAAAAGGASAFAALVATADAADGENFARRCIACHSFDEGGPNKVGPHLWGVVGRPIASVSDFAYSEAMTAFSEGGSKTWDYDTLSAYLADPRGAVPGTKMVFPGVKDEGDQANLVAYLRTLAAEPAPLPAQ